MQKYSAVISDCDGVLFDSRRANVRYYNTILAHFGLAPMQSEQIDFVHMHTARESTNYLFQTTLFQKEALEYKQSVDYSPFIKDMIMEPGLMEVLKRLKPDYGLAIATNRSDTIDKVLEYHHLQSYFDIVQSSLDVQNPKPHPECLFKILEFFKLQPDQAIYIGDSPVDQATAQAAHVDFIAYKNDKLHSSYHADSLLEILGWLNER